MRFQKKVDVNEQHSKPETKSQSQKDRLPQIQLGLFSGGMLFEAAQVLKLHSAK